MTSNVLSQTLGRVLFRVVQYASVLYCTLEFVADIVVCSGPSMQPTIESGDIVLTEHLSVTFNKLKKYLNNVQEVRELIEKIRGSVVICKSPKSPAEYICKRVVAMEGDAVVNANTNSLSYINRGHVWLEGDNKKNSIDSRSYGQVPYGLIRGRVLCTVWPLYRLGPLRMPDDI